MPLENRRKQPPPRTGVISKARLDFARVFSEFQSRLGSRTGAATIFLGVARSESADGKRTVKFLVMEAYKLHADNALQRICLSIKRKYDLNEIAIVHGVGKFRPGEPVVLVAVASRRRRASFLALQEAVERYKKEPAIFKKEIYVDGSSSWIT